MAANECLELLLSWSLSIFVVSGVLADDAFIAYAVGVAQ